MKRKKLWLYLDGKKHCDVLEWALAANTGLPEAKAALTEMYKNRIETVEFKVV
jgi:hypothetical protein